MGNISQHTAAAVAALPSVTVPAYELVPGYTTQYPDTPVYAQNFEAGGGTDGWTGGADTTVTVDLTSAASGYRALALRRTAVTAGNAVATRTMTGLVVGEKYYLKARWTLGRASSFLLSTPGATGGGDAAGGGGILYFTATATSQVVTLTATGISASAAIAVAAYVDDISVTRFATSLYTPPVMQPATTIPARSIPLSVKAASATLDDAWVPYAQATLVCAAPSIETLEALDPRKGLRVSVTLTQQWGDADQNWNSFGYRAPITRTFDLSLRERAMDKQTGEMTLTLATDEALLLDASLVANAPQTPPGATVVRAVQFALEKIGAGLPGVYRNLITNPQLGVDTTNWGIYLPGATFSSSGRYVADFTQAQAAMFFQCATVTAASIGGILYSQTAGIIPGQAFTFSGYFQTSRAANFRATIDYYNTAGTLLSSTASAYLMSVANGRHRLDVSAVAPAGAVRATLAIQAQTAWAVGQNMFAWGWMLTPGTALLPYTDGSKTGSSWDGTANASASLFVPLTQGNATVLAAAMVLNPGVSLWDYLAPLVQATGFRLWCDEARGWHLQKSWNTETQLNVSPDTGLTAGVDLISRNENWFDSVVIEYRWTDTAGVQQVRWDSAGTASTSTLYIKYADTVYPGPGAAASVLLRADGKGRTIQPSAINDYTATPGMVVVISLPDAPVQTGLLSSVTWNLPDDVMQIGSRGLADTLPGAWSLAVGPWTAATGAWTAALGTN